jgi:hypothetical protein
LRIKLKINKNFTKESRKKKKRNQNNKDWNGKDNICQSGIEKLNWK